ncbi:hypothetical protein HPC49_49210 [Pyxidicoccus fallax]|uniref:Uncharacterized protein n=1 Tax=Pyxidicoccus fallax TaxID=394095 RepID=A0A848LMT1_9BACT|nr:hypothetical protein [Pyxidicoccus fallax]NMO19118.1 hypothetical protein [Pyxidicoccus fallax]NPC86154.1 hypothetical protein [Pyxidicoccus fallax]
MPGHWDAAVCAGVLGLTAVLLVRERRRRSRVEPGMARAARLSYEYLRLHLHQFREDVAQGAGPTVEGLAHVVMLRRQHVPLFGALLRAHRHELLELADARTLTHARSLELMRRVGALVRKDPLLRTDLEAALGPTNGAR